MTCKIRLIIPTYERLEYLPCALSSAELTAPGTCITGLCL